MKHSNEYAYIVGDLHGDPYAFAQVLLLTKCVDITDDTIHLWSLPHTDKVELDTELRKSILTLKWKVGCNHTIFLLGDILDNVRGLQDNGLPFFGEHLIVETIVHLQKQGGNIIWIMGNHDVANAITKTIFPCDHYTKSIYCQTLLDGSSVKTKTRQQFAQNALLRTRAVAIKKVFDTVILCHGGICSAFLDLVQSSSIDNINNLYNITIRKGELEPILEYAMEKGISPDWCRFGSYHSKFDVDIVALERLSATSCIVGHSIHNKISYKTYNKPIVTFTDTHNIKSETTYFVDVGMSRAFYEENNKKTYACLVLVKQNITDTLHISLLEHTVSI
jgi:hypothetical protein